MKIKVEHVRRYCILNDDLLLIELERLRQMLRIAAVDVSRLAGCDAGDYLHDLSTRDYFEEE